MREKEKGYPRSFDGGVRLPRRFGGESETTGNRSVLIWETAWTTRRSGLSCLLPLFSMASLFDGSTRSKQRTSRQNHASRQKLFERNLLEDVGPLETVEKIWYIIYIYIYTIYGRIVVLMDVFPWMPVFRENRWIVGGEKEVCETWGRYLLTSAFVALVIRYRKRGKRCSSRSDGKRCSIAEERLSWNWSISIPRRLVEDLLWYRWRYGRLFLLRAKNNKE